MSTEVRDAQSRANLILDHAATNLMTNESQFANVLPAAAYLTTLPQNRFRNLSKILQLSLSQLRPCLYSNWAICMGLSYNRIWAHGQV